MNLMENTDIIKHVIDGLSIGVVVTTLIGALPPIATLSSILWVWLRIYETKTVQDFLAKRKDKGL